MPKITYKARRDLPAAIRTLKTLDRHEIIKYVLNRYNHKLTVVAINQWFYNNKDVYETLKKELKELPKGAEEEIDESMFAEGVFYYTDKDGRIHSDIPMVDKYIKGKKRKKTVKPKTLKTSVLNFRSFCIGVRRYMNPETQMKYRKGEWKEQEKRWIKECKKIEDDKKREVCLNSIVKGIDLKKHGWVIRHPERITIDDVNEHLDLMIEHYPNVDNSGVRLALRNYFTYHDIKGVDQISGRKHKSAGKYADLKLPKKTLFEMLEYMRKKANSFRDVYYQAYIACKFMYQTGTRISATLNAELDNLQMIELERNGVTKIVNVVVYDKGSLSVHGERGHRWAKKITIDLYDEICVGSDYPERRTGKMFRIDKVELRDISREVIVKFAPEILDKFPSLKVIHFWRHMMGQHWLEATTYNYGIVSAMGGWTVKALEESYGKIPEADLRELGAKYLPLIMEIL